MGRKSANRTRTACRILIVMFAGGYAIGHAIAMWTMALRGLP